MTNKTAIVVGMCLVAALAYDVVGNESANVIFLAKQGIGLIDWIAFWR